MVNRKIEPGCLCMIYGFHEKFDGKVVTAIKFVGKPDVRFTTCRHFTVTFLEHDCWEIDLDIPYWLKYPERGSHNFISQKNLMRIDGHEDSKHTELITEFNLECVE